MAQTRVDQMKRYLDEHRAEIESLPSGYVQFHIGPGDGQVKAHQLRVDSLPVGTLSERQGVA